MKLSRALILMTILSAFTATSVAHADDDQGFAETLTEAFKNGERLGGTLPPAKSEVWSGECIAISTPVGGTPRYTFLGEGYLALNRYVERGKKYLQYGYANDAETALTSYTTGYESYSLAYPDDAGDLVQDVETYWTSSDGADYSFKSSGQTSLRRGPLFGDMAYLLVTREERVHSTDGTKPTLISELRCYFNQKVD